MTSNSQHKKRLLEALEFAERMALSTVFDDKALKKSLFKLGYLYGKVCKGEKVRENAIERTLTEFYAIDPDMIKILQGDPEAYAKIT